MLRAVKLPPFSLTAADGSTVTEADLLGQPHVLYLSRHPGCNICSVQLRRVADARMQIREAGGELVIVLPIDARRAGLWREMEGLEDVIALADPAHELYRALGAARPRIPLWVLRPSTLLAEVSAVRHGNRPGYSKRDDGLQLGLDAIIARDGEIVVLHRASSPSDRLAPAELVRRIEALA